jgi:transposase
MTRPGHLTDDDATQLRTIPARSPQLDAAARHAASFATMMTSREGIRPGEWIAGVRAGTLPALHTFASGLERDHSAVQAGLTLPCSSGAVEGHVCKVKMIKRRMYGRANFDLLRKMALHN